MLNWVNRFNIFCYLNDHNYRLSYHSQECIVGAGVLKAFNPGNDFFKSLSQFYVDTNDWIFGHVSYDVKNKIENLGSNNTDHIQFPETFLFVPQVLVRIIGGEVIIGVIDLDAGEIYEQIDRTEVAIIVIKSVAFQPRISKEEYINTVNKLKQHIHQGDCYEINFCQEYYSENAPIDPLSVYINLTKISPNPFAAFYKIDDKYLICASPERYLAKKGNKLLSQPIKGTIERDTGSEEADIFNRKSLFESEKDRAENVMIVDLIRNDLSKICKEGSVQVEELFSIQSFPQVHQMTSTIVGELSEETGLAEILKATFPMGSMTGAPKKKVMQLIEEYEQTKRGIYSGTVGYITPDKDFDFNVVIRSLVYNKSAQYASYQVGSAITFYSDPEQEYQECLMKAAAIKKVLQ